MAQTSDACRHRLALFPYSTMADLTLDESCLIAFFIELLAYGEEVRSRWQMLTSPRDVLRPVLR